MEANKPFLKMAVASKLKEIKTLISGGNCQLIPRTKNNACILQLEFTAQTVFHELLGLTTENYSSGPTPDDNPNKPGDVWVFGKQLCGHEIYIKLKIIQTHPQHQVLCISFHISDHKMPYPLR